MKGRNQIAVAIAPVSQKGMSLPGYKFFFVYLPSSSLLPLPTSLFLSSPRSPPLPSLLPCSPLAFFICFYLLALGFALLRGRDSVSPFICSCLSQTLPSSCGCVLHLERGSGASISLLPHLPTLDIRAIQFSTWRLCNCCPNTLQIPWSRLRK